MQELCCESPCRPTACASPAEPLTQTAARLGSALVKEVAHFVRASDQNLGRLEAQVSHDAQELLRQAVEAGAQQKADATGLRCPTCQRALTRRSAGHPRTFGTRFGSVTVRRTRGFCKRCGKWRVPADTALGLADTAGYSPAVQEMAALLASKMPVALFGRMAIKVLSAGQLYDSMETISGPATKVTGIDTKPGTRWEFTQFFGESGDPDPMAYRRGIPHLLRQMNSGQFTGRNLDGLVTRLGTSAGQSPMEIASDLFLTILSRRPTADELRQAKTYLERSGSTAGGLSELAWVLLMTSEFSLNH